MKVLHLSAGNLYGGIETLLTTLARLPMDDPAALAAAARRLLDEPGLRERLADAGPERAQREFEQRRMAGRSVNVYRNVLRVGGLNGLAWAGG